MIINPQLCYLSVCPVRGWFYKFKIVLLALREWGAGVKSFLKKSSVVQIWQHVYEAVFINHRWSEWHLLVKKQEIIVYSRLDLCMTISEHLFYTPAFPGSESPRLAVQSYFKPAAIASSLIRSLKLHALEDQSRNCSDTNTAELPKVQIPTFMFHLNVTLL